MAELVIRHCTFRVVRHGGWSWGGDRRALIERMTRLAPELIAARLAELFADREGEIAEPVLLRIKLPARALHDDRQLTEALQGELASDRATQSFSAKAARPSGQTVQSRDHRTACDQLSSAAPHALPVPIGLRDLLLKWRENAQLLRRLSGASEATAALWYQHLIHDSRSRAAAEQQPEMLAQEACSIRDRIAAAVPDLGDGARLRLAILVELLARHGPELNAADLPVLLDRSAANSDLPHARQPSATSGKQPAHSGQPSRAATGSAALQRTATVIPAAPLPNYAVGTEVQLTSVLPFLTLGMLARIGWLDVAAASLEALALPDRGAILAAALAERLVPKAGPGTHEAQARQRTIASFAGLDHAPAPAAYAAWNRVASDGLGALSGFVADEIAEGHNPELPLLVSRLSAQQGERFAVFDADGHYPVALAPDLPTLLALLDRFRASVVLISRGAATPALIAALDGREHSYVTDAPPGRGERAQRLRGHPGLWSCIYDMPDWRIASAATQFDALADAADSGLARLLPEPSPDVLAINACLSAAMGLGLLGWQLWREHEQPTPLLALDRLATLDGTARLTPETIEVRPAVGGRYMELKRHGVLADIPGAPWLDGRRIRFSGP